MATVNIGGDPDDPSYRYKMPRILTKIEGRGNGIKTVIPNMEAVAIALGREPEYATKWFGCELGAQSRYDSKQGAATVNGAHDQPVIAELLNGFITKYVLCAKCGLPETDMLVKKGRLFFDCRACGSHSPGDVAHKVGHHIVKDLTTQAKGAKGDKKARRAKKGAKGEPEPEAKPAKAEKEKKKSRKAEVQKQKEEEEEDDDSDWGEDTSPEAVAARRRELLGEVGPSSVIKSLASDDKDDDDEVETKAPESKLAFDAALAELIDTPSDFVRKVNARGLDEATRIRTVFHTLFDDKIKAQLKSRTPILQKFITRVPNQRSLLTAFAELADEVEAVLKASATVLKYLHDKDVLDDEVTIEWFDSSLEDGAVKDAVKPFVEWLREDDDDEDDDEDDE